VPSATLNFQTHQHITVEINTCTLTGSFASLLKEKVPARGGASGSDDVFAMRQPCPSMAPIDAR
jgi:hypothetical protein